MSKYRVKNLFVSLVLLSLSSLLYAYPDGDKTSGFYEFYPSYYISTEYGSFKLVEKLPRDTIIKRDTIYISDLDALSKDYGIYMKDFINKYDTIKKTEMSAQSLFYNFFLPKDPSGLISNRIIVKEIIVGENTDARSLEPSDSYYNKSTNKTRLSREFLFTCTGSENTDLFLDDQRAIRKNISILFKTMESDTTGIDGLNLYFPDFSFKKKRPLVQFVKSVRIIMDASEKFKFASTRLSVFLPDNGENKDIDKDLSYALLQEASDIILLKPEEALNDPVVGGTVKTPDSLSNIGMFSRIKAHAYIARFSFDKVNITDYQLNTFEGEEYERILNSDYAENEWETFLFILIGLLFVIGGLVLLYYIFLPFSNYINDHIENMLFVALVVLFEIVALTICIFQFMCREDRFSILEDSPYLIFILPLLLILLLPFLSFLKRKRRLP